MTGGFLSDEALARQLQQAYDDDGYVYGDVSVADGDYWEDEVENDKDDSGMYDATSAASAKPAGERGSDDDDFVLRKKPKRGGSAKKASKLAAATPAKRGRKRKADPPTSDEASTLSADAKSSKVAKTETVSSKLSGAHQEANGNMHSSDVAFSESKLCEVEMVPAIARAAKSCGQSSTATSTSTPEPPSGLQATSEQGMKQGRWTEVEHASFLEGLELHGRNWAEVARHVGTRSKDIVKSRAQRHLIHLWLEGKDVPEKVKETGAGHTLSGKPLNPESAAVRPYLRSRKFDPEHPASTVVLPPHKTPGPENGEEMKPTPPSTDESAEKVVSARKRTVSLDYNKGSNSPLRKRRETNPGDAEKVQLEQLGIRVGEDGKTDYGRNRPRRETATKPKRQYAEDGYDLISCPPFKSLPGDGRPNCQPYRLRVERKAIAVMDLHSHLLDTEVVGLLAGVYDDGTKECTIQTALPAQRKLIAANASITVEASEESLAEALSTAESLGMQIVGWYHSHPIFCTLPSRIDCETQHAHQMAFGGSACNAVQDHGVMGEGALPSPPLPHESAQEDGKPFLGAICGPYNPKLETSQSELNWFVVVPSEAFPAGTPTPSYTAGSVAGADVAQPTRRNTVVPRRLQAVLQGESTLRDLGVEEWEAEKMLDLIRTYSAREHTEERHDFTSMWRGTETRIDKLVRSMQMWLLGEKVRDLPQETPETTDASIAQLSSDTHARESDLPTDQDSKENTEPIPSHSTLQAESAKIPANGTDAYLDQPTPCDSPPVQPIDTHTLPRQLYVSVPELMERIRQEVCSLNAT